MLIHSGTHITIWNGTQQPERLAAISGRPLPVLRRALTGLVPTPAKIRTTSPAQVKARRDAKTELFAAIRRDAQDERLSMRALATRHGVHRRTIRQALDTATPPPRKPIIREPPVLGHLHHLIDALVQDEQAARPRQRITATRIWERLLDEHDAEVSYSTVSSYLRGQRPAAIR